MLKALKTIFSSPNLSEQKTQPRLCSDCLKIFELFGKRRKYGKKKKLVWEPVLRHLYLCRCQGWYTVGRYVFKTTIKTQSKYQSKYHNIKSTITIPKAQSQVSNSTHSHTHSAHVHREETVNILVEEFNKLNVLSKIFLKFIQKHRLC